MKSKAQLGKEAVYAGDPDCNAADGDLENGLIDALTNIRHWCASQAAGVDFEKACQASFRRFAKEADETGLYPRIRVMSSRHRAGEFVALVEDIDDLDIYTIGDSGWGKTPDAAIDDLVSCNKIARRLVATDKRPKTT